VDATQGIQAQTLANCYLALDHDLEIAPVINKIDLQSARPDEVKQEIEDVIGIPADDAPLISAKTGLNIEDVIKTVIDKVPAPEGDEEAPLKALIFDSYYDSYKGVVTYIRIFDGVVKPGTKIKLMNTNKVYDVTEVGVFTPGPLKVDELRAGDVGYLSAAIRNVKDARAGDTITEAGRPAAQPLEGYRPAIPMVV